MKKYILFFILLLVPFSVYGLDYPTVHSKKVEIYDLDDHKLLYGDGYQDVSAIASLTKIATTITALEKITDLNEKVSITYNILKTVPKEASVAGLRVGDKLTYLDLIYASLLPSGADATNALAISLSGSIPAFVEEMNLLAKRIGLTNTHFVNVTGLDVEGHYSTCDDVRKLLEYALDNPTFRTCFTTKEYQMSNGKIVRSTLYTYHASQDFIDQTIGSKTGYTIDAGYCLASIQLINGHNILILVLGADKINKTYYNVQDTLILLHFLGEHYQDVKLVAKEELIQTLPVLLSNIDTYSVKIHQDIYKYLPDDYDKNLLKIQYEGVQQLDFRCHFNEKIGKISVYFGEELLYEEDVFVDTKIEFNLKKAIKRYYVWILVVFIILISSILLIINRKKIFRN